MENIEQIQNDNPNYPPFACFNNPLSKDITNNILNGETYKQVRFVKDINVIVDIGANIGASAVYFSRIYPDAQIYAFEPASNPYDLLLHNIKDYKNIKTSKIGMYSEDKIVPLYAGKIDSVTGSIGKSLYNSEITEEITLKEVNNVFEELNINEIDILKVDTEGCEIPILQSIKNSFLPKIKIVYLEYHSDSDRKILDNILSETHMLFCGNVKFFHCGEFCYVNKSVFESEEHNKSFSIVMD